MNKLQIFVLRFSKLLKAVLKVQLIINAFILLGVLIYGVFTLVSILSI